MAINGEYAEDDPQILVRKLDEYERNIEEASDDFELARLYLDRGKLLAQYDLHEDAMADFIQALEVLTWVPSSKEKGALIDQALEYFAISDDKTTSYGDVV